MKTDISLDFLTPVPRTTLTIEICRKMVSHLIGGQWREGEKIPPEQELCQKLGVGRAALREALKALRIMGMVETRLGDGTYVCDRSDFFARPMLWAMASSSETQTRELMEARTLIEVELAGLAADRATPALVQRLTEELEFMEQMKDDRRGFLKADVNFHLEIGRASSNMVLTNVLELIRNLLQPWMLAAGAADGVPARAAACEQHRRLLLAISAHDSAAARKAMQEHLQGMQNLTTEEEK